MNVFEWLESSALAVYIRQTPLLFPFLEILHIIGFIFLTGAAFLFDLRLLGVSKRIPVSVAAAYLLPWSRRSLWVVIPTGFLLFMSQATALSKNAVFGIKLLLILAAFLNAGIFHFFAFRTLTDFDHLTDSPASAKAAGIISILLWVSVITCGRLIAYF